ncbi:hypothetical protein BHE74_00055218 [Ensete ventricosum]|nr:hypothetical protein BHE74_00055218 [Ensete ventricosum]
MRAGSISSSLSHRICSRGTHLFHQSTCKRIEEAKLTLPRSPAHLGPLCDFMWDHERWRGEGVTYFAGAGTTSDSRAADGFRDGVDGYATSSCTSDRRVTEHQLLRHSPNVPKRRLS